MKPLLFVFCCIFLSEFSLADSGYQWRELFNGKNLDGWDKYVSYQPETNEYGLKSAHTPRGLHSDPNGVFTVKDGQIRVSGEEWGAITTLEEFERFHLRFEMKWGEKKWPPRESALRDSGILYFAVGPHGVENDHWMRSHEFQIQEGDSGDYHSLDGVMIDVNSGDANEGDWKFYRYDPELPLRKNVSARVVKLGLYENPNGEWDTMEVIADADTLIHIVNGHEVFRGYNSRQVDGKNISVLSKGKIQIQSEGAEVFYRNIQIRSLDKPTAASSGGL